MSFSQKYMYLTFIKVKLTSSFKMMCLLVCLVSIFAIRRAGDGSVCKSTGWSCRVHSRQQPSATAVPGDPVLLLASAGTACL